MLRNNGIVASFICCCLVTGCIESYVPRITDEPGYHYVVSGQVTDQEGYNVVTVAMASPVEDPEYIPVNDCQVEIQDNKGHAFMSE